MPSSKSTRSCQYSQANGSFWRTEITNSKRNQTTNSIIMKDLILQRKDSRDPHDGKILNKKIHKQSRKELRLWKTKWVEHRLERFENTKFLQKIKIAPVQSSACPIDSEEFAKFLGILFSSSSPLTPMMKINVQFSIYHYFDWNNLRLL